MKSNIQVLLEDLKWCIEEHGFFKGLLYSDLFDPLYRLFNLPKRLYVYITRFYYYGKSGASNTYDFDARGIDDLIYAHIKRVRKYMDSDKTHLVWNSGRKKGLIRKLYEFEELCRRKCKNEDFNDHYYFSKELDKFGRGVRKQIIVRGEVYYTYEQKQEAKKAKRKAMEKDRKIAKQRSERYYELLTKYVDGFWD